jgi:hypothetical protein
MPCFRKEEDEKKSIWEPRVRHEPAANAKSTWAGQHKMNCMVLALQLHKCVIERLHLQQAEAFPTAFGKG